MFEKDSEGSIECGITFKFTFLVMAFTLHKMADGLITLEKMCHHCLFTWTSKLKLWTNRGYMLPLSAIERYG
jgi:hypothetical protein